MIIAKRFVFTVLLFFTATCCYAALMPFDAVAASSWKWLYTLKNKGEDVAVKLPTSLFVDKEKERYYVSDAGAGGIHSYDKDGKYLNTFKPGDTLSQPFAMVRDEKGVLWVVEKGRNALTRIDLKEKKIDPKPVKVDGQDIYPDRIMLHQGVFYILDKYSGNVYAFDEALHNTSIYSCNDCKSGFIDFVVKDGSVWGLSRDDQSVYRFDLNGKLRGKIKLTANFAFPYALEVGGGGLIYILDRHKGTVVVFDQSGQFKYRFLSSGQGRDMLYYPEDIVFDPWGRLCVVDAGNGRVEVFSR